MKKIKVSELPLCKSLKGLFTLGTDANNRSCKVSLEFVEEAANAATNAKEAAEAATETAKTATEQANIATSNAANAASKANIAKEDADKATKAANTAASNANSKADLATTAAQNADAKAKEAAEATAQSKEKTDAAIEAANSATEEAMEATSSAKTATAETLATLAILVPTGLAVDAPQEITIGNTAPQRIRATLSPENAIPNVMFISDNESVKIAPDGRIKVIRTGTSEVHILPTCNTALAKTILIKVHVPTARLADTRNIIRLTATGNFRLN